MRGSEVSVTQKRCEWVGGDPLSVRYHDEEWGVPVHDDRKLFEFMVLDGMQAGLSWMTILRKRENFRRAFADFDAEKIAAFGENKIQALLRDEGIIRNRLKIEGAVKNARAFLSVRKENGSFDRYIWSFVKGRTIQNSWDKMTDIPVNTEESDAMSADLKKRGFRFVGSTICYAFMQAAGLVNDHTTDCFRYDELLRLQPS